jgi:hypothetical protein
MSPTRAYAADTVGGSASEGTETYAGPIDEAVPGEPPAELLRAGRGCDPIFSVENSHVKVCFEKDGDIFWIKDKAADGRSAMVKFNISTTDRRGSCRNPYGVGSWAYCDYNFLEGHGVSFQGYTLDHEGNFNFEHDHTNWKTECSGVKSSCHSTIPDRYVYDPDRGSLHDYCTWSSDQPSVRTGGSVDFRGPCARHDLCYDEDEHGKVYCDTHFRVRMYNECDYQYPSPSIARADCHSLAENYYRAAKQFGDG